MNYATICDIVGSGLSNNAGKTVNSFTGDKVKCFSCKIIVQNWEPSDSVLNEHYRWALGNCRYLNHIANFY